MAYDLAPTQAEFFTPFFDLLAGTDMLRKQIVAGTPMNVIQSSWQEDLEPYLRMREKYLLYPDF
jgi:uncharacterized protein YbbC (DUF1343 family)